MPNYMLITKEMGMNMISFLSYSEVACCCYVFAFDNVDVLHKYKMDSPIAIFYYYYQMTNYPRIVVVKIFFFL